MPGRYQSRGDSRCAEMAAPANRRNCLARRPFRPDWPMAPRLQPWPWGRAGRPPWTCGEPSTTCRTSVTCARDRKPAAGPPRTRGLSRPRYAMEPSVITLNRDVERETLTLKGVEAELRKVIVGQEYLLDRLLVGLLARGHVLIEGVPGLAKTLAVKTLAQTM